MGITDELRRYISGPAKSGISHICEKAISNIADRIDAEYQKAIRELNNLANASVLLPVDADGVPIRIGDVIAYKDNTKPKEVVALVPPYVVMVEDGPRHSDTCRHYHEPTVEDVLREMYDVLDEPDENDHRTFDEVIAEYAAKLQLTDDGKEQ